MKLHLSLLAMALAVTSTSAVLADDSLKAGKADLRSAGPMTFGPDGVLFVGDSMGAAVFALDTGDTTAMPGSAADIVAINKKVAALLGTSENQILINDLTVNPLSKRAYISVSRGRGPDAAAVIVRTAADGKLEMLGLDNIRHARVALPNAPDPNSKSAFGGSKRLDAITDIAFVDGKVIVAGLSNEEFSSNLRSIAYPFAAADRGTSIEIFHGSHGGFETNSPVRTFIPYKVKNQDVILAAYTCTPLVIFRTADLTPGNKVKGKTIAELGAGNRPLDMIAYSKGGSDFILMNNSSRGVMKLSVANLDSYAAITSPTDITGVPYETVKGLSGVKHLALLDNAHAVMLVDAGGSEDLKVASLP
ncbi:MAG: hypothetical protein EXR11_06445 [Rhodospirillaceae bacterium]|nr:hypothetical protein [Rhodospirillaceae bacterium]